MVKYCTQIVTFPEEIVRGASVQNKDGSFTLYVDSRRTKELESKVKELRQLQALIDEAQAEAEAIKDAIKAAMGDSEALRVGGSIPSPGSPSPPPESTPAP